jgi:hypothetical protein
MAGRLTLKWILGYILFSVGVKRRCQQLDYRIVELGGFWKEAVVYSLLYGRLPGEIKTVGSLGEDARCPGQDSDRVPLEHESRAILVLQPCWA